MGEKNYYPEKLEKELSKVESAMSKIVRKIQASKYDLSLLEIARINIYVQIQTIRLENIIEYIKEPDGCFPGNNNFIFGVYSSNDKNKILQMTEKLSNVFLSGKISDPIHTIISMALSPVIWESKENIFCVSDNAVFKEVDMDGNFLFAFLPLSPNRAIVLSKNSYFSSIENLESTLTKKSYSNLSSSVKDKLLINNYKHTGVFHLPFVERNPKKIPVYKIKRKDVFLINNAFMQDSKKLIFYDGEDEHISEYTSYENLSRKIELSH